MFVHTSYVSILERTQIVPFRVLFLCEIFMTDVTMVNLGLDALKTCLRGVANNTGTDQPVRKRRLISAFVIRCFESTECKLAIGEISI